jgi:hypothetical protein
MEPWRPGGWWTLKIEPWRPGRSVGRRPVVADSHHLDKEHDPDPH